MTDPDNTGAFAAFREAVFDDVHLLMRIRGPADRDDYVKRVVAIGAEHGFIFDASAVIAALRDGERVWLSQGAEVSS